MKSLILTLSMFTLLNNALASEAISAFAKGDTLYVTILTDGCNSYGTLFETDGICRSDRMTANYATECSASLDFVQTAMACSKVEEVPQVFEISLSESLVANEAEVLKIRYQGEIVSVKLDRK
jgi:hypothetical protein